MQLREHFFQEEERNRETEKQSRNVSKREREREDDDEIGDIEIHEMFLNVIISI